MAGIIDKASVLRSTTTNAETLLLQAYDVDGGSYTTFITLTNANTPTCVLADGVTATTQSASDNSTKLATTAYVDTAIGSNNELSEILANGNTTGANDIIVANTQSIETDNNVGDTMLFRAYDTNLTGYVTFITFTANNTPTCDLSTSVTMGSNAIYYASGTDVAVADGGTGRSSHTAYSVICGGTTSTAAQQSVSGVGTSGQVLTSNGAGALPTWQAAAAGNLATVLASGNTTGGTDISVTSGDVITTASAASLVLNTNSGTTSSSLTIGSGAGNTSTFKMADINSNFTFESENASTLGPVINFYHNSSSPAVDDDIAKLRFLGKDDATNDNIYGEILVVIDDPTAASTDSTMEFQVERGGIGLVSLLNLVGSSNTLEVGNTDAAAVITTRGTNDLTLSTNNGTNSGTITITDGVDGDILLTPNGVGQVGVNTASPSATFHVTTDDNDNQDNARFTSNEATNDTDNVVIDGTTGGTMLKIDTTGTTQLGAGILLTANSLTSGSAVNIAHTGAGDASQRSILDIDTIISSGTHSDDVISGDFTTEFSGNAIQSTEVAFGIDATAKWNSTGAAEQIIGCEGSIEIENIAHGTITSAAGLTSDTIHGGQGTVTSLYGVLSSIEYDTTGTTTNSYGVAVSFTDNSAAAHTWTNQYGVAIGAVSLGATLNVGVDIGAVSGATTNYALRTSTGLVEFGGRVKNKQGADVASANNLTLGEDGNTFEITGTTEIQLIDNTDWQNGSKITLLFTSTPTVKDATATSGSNITILLDGSADFSATAGDTLTLLLSEIGGTQAWREVGRTAL